ncbi:protein lifeguard 2-like [Argonauta hians]
MSTMNEIPPPPDYNAACENPSDVGNQINPIFQQHPASYVNPSYAVGDPNYQQNPNIQAPMYGAVPAASVNPSYVGDNPNYQHDSNPPPLTSTKPITEPEADKEFGSSYNISNLENNDFGGSSFSDKAIRRAFIRKVYLILTGQLLLTIGIIVLCIFVDEIKFYIQENLWVYLTSYGIFLCVYFVLVCIKSARRTYPGNIIGLLVLTVSMALVLGTISSFHDTDIVLMAMVVTAVVCLSISLFAVFTNIDFTMCFGLMFTFFVVVILFGLSVCITQVALSKPIPVLTSVYGALIALLYAWFLVFDTQLIMGGKKYELDPEEYIFGALALYIDIVDFFLLILSIMGGNSN